MSISYQAIASGSKTLHLPHVFVICQEINPFNSYLIVSFLVSKTMGVVKRKIIRKNIMKNVMKSVMKNMNTIKNVVMFF